MSLKSPPKESKRGLSRSNDGSLAAEAGADLDNILSKFESLGTEERGAFLSVIAHDLTIAIRSIVYDPPVSEDGIERIKWINEALHQLTSCLDPQHRWSARDEAELVRGIIDDSSRHGLDKWLDRAITAAARKMANTGHFVAAR